MTKISCHKCKYYFVTWDPKHPKGCKLFGFKSAGAPSIAVYSSTGAECNGYEEKQLKNDKKD